jgi:hypothetical protein
MQPIPDTCSIFKKINYVEIRKEKQCYITDHLQAEKLWLVCGVMGDVMLYNRESGQKCYATIHSEKITYLTIVLICKHQFPAAVCFRGEQ